MERDSDRRARAVGQDAPEVHDGGLIINRSSHRLAIDGDGPELQASDPCRDGIELEPVDAGT